MTDDELKKGDIFYHDMATYHSLSLTTICDAISISFVRSRNKKELEGLIEIVKANLKNLESMLEASEEE